ncbi:MAG: ribonuclease R, partial [Pelodictyon phaeoclathratiforme]
MAKERFKRKTRSPGNKGHRPSVQFTGERVKPNDHILINEFLFRRGESSLGAEIVTFFADHDGERFKSVELAKALGYTESKQLPGFWYVLHKLQEEGAVDKDSNRCYGMSGTEATTYEDHLELAKPFPLPGKKQYTVAKSYTGHISTHPNGYGFVDVEGFDDDIFIKAGDMGLSIHGDEVEVLVSKVPDTYSSKSTPHQRCEGAVQKVLTRRITTIVGTLTKANRKFVLKADDRKILPEIIVPI